MAAQGMRVCWDESELQKNPMRWNTSWDRPQLSPFPHPNDLIDTDDDSHAIKSVLSIDGGGIRGYSSLIILQALMEEVGQIERAHNPKATSSICSSALGPLDDAMAKSGYRPCHYFDYIAGVGTGGIIAMMLGRYRMTVHEAMKKYRKICAKAVKRQLIRRKSIFSRNHKASKSLQAHTVKLVSAWASPDEDEAHLKSDPRRCCTIVCGCGPKMQTFRSDAISSPPILVDDVIWQCVDEEASREPQFYNNPSRTVLREVSSLPDASSPDDEMPGNVRISLLSIGGAINESVDPRADRLQYQMSCQIQRVHQELSTEAYRFNLEPYHRLDVPDDALQEIGVNEWKRGSLDHFALVEKATNTYLRNAETANELHDIATALVEKRRRRAGTLQWERWALGVSYRCPELDCVDWNERFDDSAGFWAHMLRLHGVERAGYDEATGRVYDEYEAMGRTREKNVNGEINPHDVLEGGFARKSIDEGSEKRERD